MNKELICISCPQGCRLNVTYSPSAIDSVQGGRCKRGDSYAESEVFNPMRMVTTTVRIDGSSAPLLPVKTSGPVPREKTMEVIAETRKVRLSAPVRCGDVVLANVLDTGVDILATRSLDAI